MNNKNHIFEGFDIINGNNVEDDEKYFNLLLERAKEELSQFNFEEYVSNTSENVIDIGSGNGRHLFLLSRKYNKCIGIEPAKSRVETCNTIIEKKNIKNVEIIQNEFQNVNLKNINFDLILCMTGIFNLVHPLGLYDQLIELISSIAKIKSKVLVELINLESFFHEFKIRDNLKNWEKFNNGPYDYSFSEIKKISENDLVEKTTYIKSSSNLSFNREIVLTRISQERIIESFSTIGFRCNRIFGDYRGSPVTDKSPRILLEFLRV